MHTDFQKITEFQCVLLLQHGKCLGDNRVHLKLAAPCLLHQSLTLKKFSASMPLRSWAEEGRKLNVLHSPKEKNRKWSSHVIAGANLARLCHHSQHIQSIFLADSHSSKLVLKVSSGVDHRLVLKVSSGVDHRLAGNFQYELT